MFGGERKLDTFRPFDQKTEKVGMLGAWKANVISEKKVLIQSSK